MHCLAKAAFHVMTPLLVPKPCLRGLVSSTHALSMPCLSCGSRLWLHRTQPGLGPNLHAQVATQARSKSSRSAPTLSVEAPSRADGPASKGKEVQADVTDMLREYQAEAVQEVLKGWQKGQHRQLVAMATGAGKTFTFCYLTSKLARRTLILVHRSELVQQTVNTLARLGHVEDVGVVHGKKKQFEKHIVISTVQSACQPKTLKIMEAQGFQVCVVDEAHHAIADTWMTVLLHTGFIEQDIMDRVKRVGRRRVEADEAADKAGAAASRGAPIALLSSGADGISGDGSTSGSISSDDDAALSLASTDGGSGSDINSTSTSGGDGAALSLTSSEQGGASTSGDDSAAVTLRSVDGASTSGSDSDTDLVALAASQGTAINLASPAPEQQHLIQFQEQAFTLPPTDKLLLGVTATPYRNNDKHELSYLFQNQAYEVAIGFLIDTGWLCKIQAHRVLTYVDISKVRTMGKHSASDEDGTADYVASELSKVINTPSRNQLVVDSYKSLGAGRKAIAFCCDIKHAEALSQMFRENGVSSESVSSKSGSDRPFLLEEHKTGAIQVLTNVGILTEGYDDPSISCVLMTRPTKSTGLYTQSVGRGLRIHPGKQDCLIIDFTDRAHHLDKESDLITCAMLFEPGKDVQLVGYLPPPPPKVEPQIKHLLKGGAMTLYRGLKLSWVPLGRDLWLHINDWKAPQTGGGSGGYQGRWSRGGGFQRPGGGFQRPGQKPETKPAEAQKPTVWVHLQRGEPDIAPRSQKVTLRYQLRMARGKDMPALDSEQWEQVDIKVAHRPPDDPATPSGSSDDEEAEWDDEEEEDEDEEGEVEQFDAPPVAVVAQAEKLLTRIANERKHGLTPEMLSNVHKGLNWSKQPSTPAQQAKLLSSNADWKLFSKTQEHLLYELNKGQASGMIALGVLYSAYKKANSHLLPQNTESDVE